MFSHLDARQRPTMVDVGDKPVTARAAEAEAIVVLPAAVTRRFRSGEIATAKGPILQTASLAGVMAAKRTCDLIPLCHPLPLDDCQVQLKLARGSRRVTIRCRVRTHARTGVEMEALTGASVAALTVYDMAKSVAPGIVIQSVRLLEKTGGRSDYRARRQTHRRES